MAQVECTNNVQSVSDNKLIDEADGPPSKKLRQARLPFKPLDQKPQLVPSSSPQNSKKRKLSDGESPSAKPPKSYKPVIVEKPQPMVDHDPEVSSSSETENVSLSNIKARVRNTLERFVRKNSQEEISSTNTDDCIDLTEEEENADSSENDANHISEDKENREGSKKICPSNEKIPILKSSECDAASQNVEDLKMVEPVSDTGKQKVVKESVPSNQGQLKVQDETVVSNSDEQGNDKTLPEQTKNTETKENMVDNQNDIKSSEQDTSLHESQEKSSDEKNVSKIEKTPKRGIDVFFKKVSESKVCKDEEAKDSVIDKSIVEDDVDMISEEKDDSSMNSDYEADSEVDSSSTGICKTGDNMVTPAKEKPKSSLMKTPGSVGRPDNFVTPSRSPDELNSDGTPTSTKPKKRLSAVKLKEREEARQQREKEKEEKRLQKEQERLEKEKEKEEKKKQREEEKAEKERQKQEEKDKREKERLEKLKLKEEERKKKQEILDAKMEEKKKKEEEKKQKEEEKMKEIEEKQKKEKKVKQAFAGFFIPKTSPVSKPTKESSGLFMPFEAKADMVLAPTVRRNELNDDQRAMLDNVLEKQDCSDLYLQKLKKGEMKPRKSEKTCPRISGADQDVILVHDKETVKKVTYRCKLLQFHENYRPPYYGTWRKNSKVLKAKNPFKQDSDLFDYEVDSDDEWEEEEPGESLSASEGEDEKEEGADEDDEDGWMVPHGYLSDDEGCEEDEEVNAEKKSARQMAKAEAWEAELKRQACPLKAVIIGCFWEQAVHSLQEQVEKTLQCYKAVNLLSGPVPTSHSIDLSKGNQLQDQLERPSSATPKSGQKKPVPEEAMPDLIRMVHGNLAGIKKLVKEFRTYWDMKTGEKPEEKLVDVSMEVDEAVDLGAKKEDIKDESSIEKQTDVSVSENSADNFSISKRQLELKISSVAVREKREGFKKVCWYVHDSLLQQYNLQDLPVPSAWEFLTKPYKTPNKQKTEDSPAAVTIGRKTPAVSITQFARPMSPSTIAAQNAAVMANIKQHSAKQAETKMEIEADIKDVKPVPTDQKTIMQFTQKVISPKQSTPATNLHPGTKTLATLLVTPLGKKENVEGVSVQPRRIIPTPVAFSPVSKSKPDVTDQSSVDVISPKPAKCVVNSVNIIPPSMIRSNLSQVDKSAQGSNFNKRTPPGGDNSGIPAKIKITAESDSSTKEKVESGSKIGGSQTESRTNTSSSIGASKSLLSPVISVLNQMGDNSNDAILIE